MIKGVDFFIQLIKLSKIYVENNIQILRAYL